MIAATTTATKRPTPPSSFLHPVLSAWRAARSGSRVVAYRKGEIVLSEFRLFDRYEAAFLHTRGRSLGYRGR